MSFTYLVSQGLKTSPMVEGIGITKDIKHSSFGPGKRKGYTIHFNINGKGYFNGNPLKKGQGFLVYDGMYAEHRADPQSPWELMWITLSGDSAERIFKSYNSDPDTNIFNFDFNNFMEDVLNKLRTTESTFVDSLELLNMFLSIHCNCMKTSSHYIRKTASEIYLGSALKYIKNNIYRNINVDDLISFIGVSQPYLYKIFKTATGMSPKQYIINSKLELAKNMLLNTDMTITEIANSVGYEDVLAFSRMFASKEKLSPRSWRAENNL